MVRSVSLFSLIFLLHEWHTGLIGHLKTHFPPMYRLFDALKNRLAPPTDEELLIAAGKKILDQDATSEFLKRLERSSKTVIQAFNEQNLKAAVSYIIGNHDYPSNFPKDKAWDQKKFETLLTEWMVVCDQPFEEVDRPEFRELLAYTHFRPSLRIPHRGTLRNRVMKMGEDTVAGVRKLISVTALRLSKFAICSHSRIGFFTGIALQSQPFTRCMDIF